MSILKKKDLGGYIEFLSQKHEVYAPTHKHGTISLRRYEKDAQTVFNQSIPSISPKNYFLKHGETLFALDETKTYETPPTGEKIFLGVTLPDAWALKILDNIMLDEPADYYYARRREKTLVCVFEDHRPPPNSFHHELDINLNEGFDLCFTEFKDEYDITVGSDRGLKLLSAPQIKPGQHHLIQKKQKSAGFNLPKIKDFLDQGPHKEPWIKLSEKCISCGLCSWVCPLSYGFSLEDSASINSQMSIRSRRWESIMREDFRGQVEDHVRIHNWFHNKFSKAVEERGTPDCVGCGRCTTFCPAGIDFKKTLKECQENAN